MVDPTKPARALLLAMLWAVAPSAVADSTQWGLGAAAGPRPLLSLQFSPSSESAYHVTTHYSETLVELSGDFQRRLAPSLAQGQGWKVFLYGGGGLAGTSERDAPAAEEYRLRLPLGAQCDFPEARLSTFVEAAGLVGPLPVTRLTGIFTGGLRANF